MEIWQCNIPPPTIKFLIDVSYKIIENGISFKYWQYHDEANIRRMQAQINKE